ncbi:NAD(P)H-binding protein [Paenibacillus glufosinatiresistens]|uniref:NAD(P)H-binding protein n=1 Tax=Paenibacillus glufosinatiresistens TaxID=3070657 RepID=UPI00286E35CE|nr:NAD(P)H-binding protein [Paenibacillus sp. YX.27]
MARTALVLGATGLVGRALTKELLLRESWGEVRVLVRRSTGLQHDKLTEYPVDWDRLDLQTALFEGVDAVFSCLGTTIKKAGSQPAFEKVDLHYPLAAARLARQAGVGQYLAISSLGAHAHSKNFYLRTKGRMEEGVLGSGIPGIHLFRPSLLLGTREEFRFGERLAGAAMRAFGGLMVGRAAVYRAVTGDTVARAMAAVAESGAHGSHIYTNDVIQVLGSRQEPAGR